MLLQRINFVFGIRLHFRVVRMLDNSRVRHNLHQIRMRILFSEIKKKKKKITLLMLSPIPLKTENTIYGHVAIVKTQIEKLLERERMFYGRIACKLVVICTFWCLILRNYNKRQSNSDDKQSLFIIWSWEYKYRKQLLTFCFPRGPEIVSNK